ncbi:BRCA1-associated ATM activator 1 isoform X2 [Melanotaenia boesemani]|uniref:BRCA1-associated ATM activator 1 isoform X2 n=1 Tax=Melanotaenia boesemani TaxID=1250792 RepID=UPI001C05E0F6|nr:BRCA1-associated ATM activator 1 isoform X2 [Melanotaenia boesemani]
MESECVSVLPRVCEVLAASGRSLPDDTSLEKLLDWFTALTDAGVSLLETCPCLLKFISTVVNHSTPDPSILAFILKLTGLIAANEDNFQVLQESPVLDLVFDAQHWQGSGLWEDPSVRVGWLWGLRTMLQHSKALSFFVQAEFIEPLLQLQTDASLFVASAANQMLAHILISCQPVSSAGCKGVYYKEDRRTGTDREHLTATVETDKDGSAFIMAISEYFKKLLVPKDASQLHHSQQVLKLLALLLAQTSPPLQEKLLLTVTDSLEELVTTNYSQLTLPLMDVILAAHSCGSDGSVPDQRIAHLLSFMLNTRKPADLILAAAAFLHSGYKDHVHRAQSSRVLLLPLDIVTGLNLLGTNILDEHRFSMMEQLGIKTSCVTMICVSLTNIPQIAQTAPDLLPCPLGLIVSAVISLLRLCSGNSSSSSAGCLKVSRNVTGSGKVQKCALEALLALSNSSEAQVMLVEVFSLLIHYLDNPDCDPTVLQKAYQVLVKWISVCTDLSAITDQLRKDLIQVVRKRACDIRWEVRDSTVEFLGHLAGVHACQTSAEEVCSVSEALLGGCCFSTPLLKDALQDPESYVRASSISSLAQTLAHSWHQGAALTQEQAEIVTQLLEILSQDTEGFARRAVVQYFTTWLSSCSSPTFTCSLLMQSVCSVLSLGSADLDWEVKVYTLDLAGLLIDQAFSGYHSYTKVLETQPHPYALMSTQTYTVHAHTETHTEHVESDLVSVLNSLGEQGVISALLCGLFDCDRPVALKACRLLIRLRDIVCPPSLSAQDASVALATDNGVTCELSGRGWAQEIRNILRDKNQSGTGTTEQRPFQGTDMVDSEGCGEAAMEHVRAGSHTVRVNVCEVLRSLDLDEKLEMLTQSSDHIHNSPLSLLQDILTASITYTHPNSEPGQEVIVDCY